MDYFESLAEFVRLSHWRAEIIIGLRIIAIALVASLLMRGLQPVIRLFRDRIMRGLQHPDESKRAHTFGRVFHHLTAVVLPLQQWDVRREFLRRLKQRFGEENIEVPYPHLLVYSGDRGSRQAPAYP